MDLLFQVAEWLAEPAHWRGVNGIPHRLTEHLVMSGAVMLVAVLLALPVGLVLGHTGRGAGAVLTVANAGREIPSLALLILGTQAFGIGAAPAFVALLALAVPPVVTNAYVGIQEVDADAREAARGMGMTGTEMLLRVEAPMAVPLIMAGIRTSGVQVVATTSLAAVVAWGGLGRYVVDGLAQQDQAQMLAGALLVGGLSLVTELVLSRLQAALTSPGLSRPPRATGGGPPALGRSEQTEQMVNR